VYVTDAATWDTVTTFVGGGVNKIYALDSSVPRLFLVKQFYPGIDLTAIAGHLEAVRTSMLSHNSQILPDLCCPRQGFAFVLHAQNDVQGLRAVSANASEVLQPRTHEQAVH